MRVCAMEFEIRSQGMQSAEVNARESAGGQAREGQGVTVFVSLDWLLVPFV